MSKETRRQLGDMLRELNLTGVAATHGEADRKSVV